MPNILDAAAIRKQLSDYLTRKMSFRSFNNWFVPATWDVESTASENTRELVYEILLNLAEYTSGHLTEHDLRANLGRLVTSSANATFQLAGVPVPRTPPVTP